MRKARAWKKLSTKRLLTHSRIKIDEDTVMLPNGAQTTYVRLAPGGTDSVIVIAINSNREILLQKEYSYPPDKIMWQLPGGSMHNGETIIDAANRELAEESGYTAKECVVIGFFYTNNRLSDKRQHVVVATELTKHKLPEDEDEFIDSYWIKVDDIPSHVERGEFVNVNLLAALHLWIRRGSA